MLSADMYFRLEAGNGHLALDIVFVLSAAAAAAVEEGVDSDSVGYFYVDVVVIVVVAASVVYLMPRLSPQELFFARYSPLKRPRRFEAHLLNLLQNQQQHKKARSEILCWWK